MQVIYLVKSMVMEAKGTFTLSPKGKTGVLYVPADIVKDSAFPFQPGEKVKVRIEGNRLIVEKT